MHVFHIVKGSHNPGGQAWVDALNNYAEILRGSGWDVTHSSAMIRTRRRSA